MRLGGWLAVLGAVAACATPPAGGLVPYRIEGDSIREPLVLARGDAARGRSVVASRDANCLLCHAVPGFSERLTGNVGPSLAGVGSRFSEGQLRLRIVDSMRLNPDTVMPSYYRTRGLNEVAAAWRGKPVLTAQQVEDTIAYLLTLR